MSKNIALISPYTLPIERNGRSFSARSFVDQKSTYFLTKRSFDLIISILIITFVLSWLVPVLGLLIWLDSRGPVFFRQRRVGKGGKSFYCYKFRTMRKNAECNIRQAERNDSRITRLGKFLRASNIDELPQFYNVLVGQMSIVGPRPHMHADCSKFSSIVRGYKFRNLVKPGITGLAQVKGYHGPTVTYESIFRRFQFDAFYVRNANFWLDLRILRKTVIRRIGQVNHQS